MFASPNNVLRNMDTHAGRLPWLRLPILRGKSLRFNVAHSWCSQPPTAACKSFVQLSSEVTS